jgi:peptidyl-prolyl cis-trans isomerase A (cyclophilin A)
MLRRVFIVIIALLLSTGSALADGKENPLVLMETSRGNVKLELFRNEAPVSVRNFLAYAASGFYDGTIFHRVIRGFMIQGGGFDAEFRQKETRLPIRNEADNGLKNRRGTMAMARTSDPDSATAQFFINLVDNRMLDHPSPDGHGYAVFGRVIEGMDVVDGIAGVRTGSRGGFQDVPLEQVQIRSVRVIR